MLDDLWDTVTDVAETAAIVTGNREVASLIDTVDDLVEEFIGEGDDD